MKIFKNRRVRKALKSVRYIIGYMLDEEAYLGQTEWVDRKGYSMSCDMGYFYEGLRKLLMLLSDRLDNKPPKYRCDREKYNE